MDQYVIGDILSYVDTDTKLVLNNVNKNYHVNSDMLTVSTLDVYKCCSIRLVKHYISLGVLQIDSQSMDTSGLFNMSNNINNEYIVLWMLQRSKKSKKSFLWENVFCNACTYGWKDIVEYMINVDACYVNGGFEKACLFGHMDIVKILLTKVNSFTDWDEVLSHACCGGNKEIIELIVKQGNARKCYTCDKSAIDHLKK